MDKKKKSSDPFSIWPPPRKKDEEKNEELNKPRNSSYVDRFEELARDGGGEIFEDDAEQKEQEERERLEREKNGEDEYNKDKK